MTEPGVVKGKFSYLSPEAARGEEVDSRADIFAVGILLYEMLTGKRLFYGETDYQTVELVRNAKIPPLRPQNSQVEPELEDIVRKALSKRKEDRFQNATDMQDALAQYSYSRGLKVISRDIAELVRQCLDDKRMQSGEGKKPSIVEHILQGELVKFTSVDFEDPGAQPLTADEMGDRNQSRRQRRTVTSSIRAPGPTSGCRRGRTAPSCARSKRVGPHARRRPRRSRRPARAGPPSGCASPPARTARRGTHRLSLHQRSRRRALKRWPACSSRPLDRRRRCRRGRAPRRLALSRHLRMRGGAFSSAR